MKKYFVILLIIFSLFFTQNKQILAQNTDTNVSETESAKDTESLVVNFFYSSTCPHCKNEKPFLEKLQSLYGDQITINSIEISQSNNAKIMQEVGKKLNIQVGGVPFTLVGREYILGYGSDEVQGAYLQKLIDNCLQTQDCNDILAEISPEATTESQNLPTVQDDKNENLENTPKDQRSADSQPSIAANSISVPFFGSINPKSISLPLLTFVIGALDGFNPCAMWTLVFLIGLLINLKNPTRRWLLGITFILASGLIYFLFMSAWLNFFLFMGLLTWVRLGIGALALGAGIYNIYDFFTNKEAACKVTQNSNRKNVFEKLKKLTSLPQLWLAMIGIISLAFAVNIVELFCSAGFPAIYTQILTLSNLPGWKYYLYLIFYIIVFMADDLLIFFIAMKTLQISGLDSKYAHWSRIIGGVVILIVGILLIFKPELLMFG